MQKFCIKCHDVLNFSNWKKGNIKSRRYICSDCDKKRIKKDRFKLKNKIIEIYGGKCTCCAEKQIEFLSIDHIDGTGAKHRKEMGLTCGNNFYHWLKNNDYPKDNFQILCFNCNFAKHAFGTCPHQKKKKRTKT